MPDRPPEQVFKQTAADDYVGWCRVSDLCAQIGVSARTGARWAGRVGNPALCRKRPKSSGGSPEWWVGPEAARAFRAAVVAPDDNVDVLATASSAAPVAADDAVVEAMRLAVDEARARTASAEAERDRLRAELGEERVRRERAERQAEESERARMAYAETLAEERAAWWQWVSFLNGLSWLRRLRRLPNPPEALTRTVKRLAAPEGKGGAG